MSEHPAPWRWVEDDRGPLEDPVEDEHPLVLVDANDVELIAVDDMSEPYPFVSVVSERVRRLIAAAPRMEALLREVVDWSLERGEEETRGLLICRFCGVGFDSETEATMANSLHDRDCFAKRCSALLAELDAAKGGDRG